MSEKQTILWFGDAAKAAKLYDLLAAKYRVVVASGTQFPADIDRCAVLAEGAYAAAAFALIAAHPEAVTALALLAPAMFPDREIKLPVLAAFGTQDDAPPETRRQFRERVPNGNIVFVYDAGAAMAAERPEAVAELLTEFFARGDAFLVRQVSDQLFP